jgi:transcriptional regulator GlxA family with amidase domain
MTLKQAPAPQTRAIGFLLMDGHALMSTAAAVEPLRAANLLAGRNLYDMTFLSPDSEPVAASVGAVFPTRAFADAGTGFDLLFVVAGGVPASVDITGLAPHLRAQARAGVPLGGISGGAVILARAGLMANRRFTVHWQHFEALAEMSQDFLVERKLFVIDRDRYTCAGGAAPLDMIHAMIVAHHGIDLARAVSDWFIHTSVRAAGDPQRAGPVERYNIHHPALVAAIELMQTHLADALSLTQIARLTGVSLRQIQRLFTEELGQPAMRFYRGLRLQTADTLLTQSALPIGEIAVATGFATPAHFSRAFCAAYGLSPSARRRSGRARH